MSEAELIIIISKIKQYFFVFTRMELRLKWPRSAYSASAPVQKFNTFVKVSYSGFDKFKENLMIEQETL